MDSLSYCSACFFISVDNSEEKIELTSKTIRHKQADFVYGDWKEIIDRGPFHFIFADAAIV
jgi:predicted O-methyltransferase YrrM